MVKHGNDLESVPMSFAPTQFRGQRLLSGSLGPMMFTATFVFGVVNIYRDEAATGAFFLALSLVPASLMAIVWPNHLRAVKRATRRFDGVSYLIYGGCGWRATQEPHQGEKIGKGFVRVVSGSLEIRTGAEAKLVARYRSGQLERAVALRVMWGLLEPVVRLSFTDGMTYDILLDHAGPKGLLPLRQKRLDKFVVDVRSALAAAEPRTL